MRSGSDPGPAFETTLTAAVSGDEAAFTRLFRSVQPALLRYLGTMAPDDADDLAGEVWVHVVRGLPKFRGDEQRFRSWVFTIARSRWVDHLRVAGRRPVTVDDAGLVDVPASGDVSEAVEERLSTERAMKILAELPADQAEVVLLRVVGGLDVARTAKVVGKRPGAVRTLAHRGLRRLAERLGRPRPRSLSEV